MGVSRDASPSETIRCQRRVETRLSVCFSVRPEVTAVISRTSLGGGTENVPLLVSKPNLGFSSGRSHRLGSGCRLSKSSFTRKKGLVGGAEHGYRRRLERGSGKGVKLIINALLNDNNKTISRQLWLWHSYDSYDTFFSCCAVVN